jgi:hypothetical protein
MNDITLLLRQIHPEFVQDKRPSSQAFRPTPKDEKKLSVYDGDQISPEAAWRHYTEELGLASCGALAVCVAECSALDLPVVPDPESFPEHCLVDFSEFSKSATEKKAKLLKAKAIARGWQYVADGV